MFIYEYKIKYVNVNKEFFVTAIPSLVGGCPKSSLCTLVPYMLECTKIKDIIIFDKGGG